jgi:hypothetical protein
MPRFIATTAALLTLGLTLAGCGQSRGDRAVSGGLIGAGAGAAVSAIVGGPLLVGAAIGAGAGALGGAATNPRDINLGKPAWE